MPDTAVLIEWLFRLGTLAVALVSLRLARMDRASDKSAKQIESLQQQVTVLKEFIGPQFLRDETLEILLHDRVRRDPEFKDHRKEFERFKSEVERTGVLNRERR